MKASEILEVALMGGINFEDCWGLVDVPEVGPEYPSQCEEWWIGFFGGLPPHEAESGKYMYVYSDTCDYPDLFTRPDVIVELGDGRYVYLIKIDE